MDNVCKSRINISFKCNICINCKYGTDVVCKVAGTLIPRINLGFTLRRVDLELKFGIDPDYKRRFYINCKDNLRTKYILCVDRNCM